MMCKPRKIQLDCRVTTIILLSLFILSCENPINHNYKWKIKVVYTDSNIDTLECDHDGFNGNQVGIYLKIAEPELLTNSGISPCVVMGCGFYRYPVACDVRRFEILEFTKTKLK